MTRGCQPSQFTHIAVESVLLHRVDQRTKIGEGGDQNWKASLLEHLKGMPLRDAPSWKLLLGNIFGQAVLCLIKQHPVLVESLALKTLNGWSNARIRNRYLTQAFAQGHGNSRNS